MIKFSFKAIFLFGLVVMFTIVGLFSTIYFGLYIFTGGSPIIENIKLVSKLILLLTGLFTYRIFSELDKNFTNDCICSLINEFGIKEREK